MICSAPTPHAWAEAGSAAYRSAVPFTVLPAIDVTSGRLGVWTPSGPEPVEAFGGDPVAAARAFAAAGARWLHVVDMDLAFGGEPANLGIVERIAGQAPTVRLQISGGIDTAALARRYLGAGGDRYVLASRALADPEAAAPLVGGSAGPVLIGLEVDDGRIRGRGDGAVDLDLMGTLGWLAGAGAPGFLLTAVGRVGGGAGPDAPLIRRVARVGLPVMAAGGIASLEDLRAAREAGAVGAVVGRAALDGSLDLAAALTWAAA